MKLASDKKSSSGSALGADPGTDSQIREALAQMVEKELPEGPPPGSRTRNFRFGVSMLILAVLSAVLGAYPLPASFGSRVLFLVFAVVLALIGAYFLDKSSRIAKRIAPAAAPRPEPSLGPRRVK